MNTLFNVLKQPKVFWQRLFEGFEKAVYVPITHKTHYYFLLIFAYLCYQPLAAQTITGTVTPACSNNGTITVNIPASITLSAVRHIRIQMNKNDYLHLGELRAFEVGTGTNVALNKTVTSFSNWSGHLPSYLVDGDVNTLGHSANAGTQEFLEVDLGATYLIDRIEIVNRGECCQNRADNLLLILKDNSGTTINSRQIDAYQGQNNAYTSTWNVTDVSWTDGATTLNRTGLAAGNYTINYSDVNSVTAQQTFNVPNASVPSVSIVSNDADNTIVAGTSVTFTATPTNGGTTPSYQWKKNGNNVGTNSATYTDAALVNNDVITVVMTSNADCISPTTATSNSITMTVTTTPAITGTVTPTCNNNGAITVTIPTSFTLSAVRHIRIQMNKNDYLHLGELRAFEVGTGTNVALNKTATSFSNWSGHLPSYLVDGDVNTLGHSANAGTQEFLEVDLGATYLIDRIEIVNRGECCQDRADNLLLILKDNSGTTINSRQIDASTSVTTSWNVTDVSWADGATTLNRTGLAAGNYTINYSDVNSVTAQQTFNVTSLASPTLFNVTGNNGFSCNGTGVAIGLSNSETGVNYQLKRSGTDVGSVVAGTNAALNFGNQTVSGTYTVVATHATSGCTATMTGSATITVESSTLTPSVTIVSNDADNSIIVGTSVTFTATPTNGGTTPSYQWKKNGNNVGTNSTTYTDAALANNDVISCVLTSANACASPTTATSNSITMTVIDPCAGITDNRIYVKIGGTGNGSSWANALGNLQDALHNTCSATEIWVAAGTYLPTKDPFGNASPTDPRDKTFYVKDGIRLYGGFAGTETQLSQRNIAANPTILSGDIGTLNDNSDNCYHVVVAISNSSNTSITVNGFIITKGMANGSSGITLNTFNITRSYGAGLFARNAANTTHNYDNNIFQNNATTNYGGGMYIVQNSDASNAVTNCRNNIFKNNTSSQGGGGLYAINNGNSGIIYVTNNSFTNNSAVYNGGGALAAFVAFAGTTGTQYYTNNTFYANSTSLGTTGGGGLAAVASPSSGNTGTFYSYNNIFWANTHIGRNNIANTDIYISTRFSLSLISHCLTQENSTYSSGTGIVNNQDPLFTNAANGDFTLQAGSPCINAGNNTAWTATGLTTDLAGNTRPNGVVDMGAYEYNCGSNVPTRLYVAENGTGDGSSWANATGDLQTAINNPCGITEIWVKQGTYKPVAYPKGCMNCSSNRDYAFYIKDGVSIYGGFAGMETTLSQRNITTNPTILSGDIGTLNDNSDNCYHVVLTSSPSSGGGNTRIDGFIIKDGNANNAFQSSNITLNGNMISRGYGGGMITTYGNNTLVNNILSNNSAYYGGGGLHTFFGNNTFANNTMLNNSASIGGAVYAYNGSNTLTNNTLYNNASSSNGGGINVLFGSHTLTNNIFWDNKSNNANNVAGADIYQGSNTTMSISYSLTQANSTYSSGTGIINNQDPLFTNAASGNFTLQASSPCINAGSNAAWTATGLTTDFAGNTRPNGVVDMGAYEYQTVLPIALISFSGKHTEGGNLLSWQTAEEENAAHFDIERSLDGKNFTKIGQVKAKGSYSQYEFLDDKNNATVLYYRLRMNDLDKKFDYSKIISIVREGKNKVKIYPSVTADNITIEGAKSAEIVNMTGQVVIQQSQLSNSTISLQYLPSGIYFVRGEATEGGYFVEKVIKY